MASWDDRLQETLDGFATFLPEKASVLAKHRPYLVRWVKEFVLFVQAHGGYTFAQTGD